MTDDLVLELDQGARIGPALAAAALILVAPAVAKAAAVAGWLAPAGDAGTTAYWLWVLVGGPAAFLLAQRDVYAVRRVGLALSPGRGRWEVVSASLGGVDRAAGSLQDVARAELTARGPHQALVQLIGRDGAVLAEVPGPAAAAAEAHGRVVAVLAEGRAADPGT